MNNNEAKRVILEVDSCFCLHGAYKDCHSGCKYREALDAAVKALEQEPTTKNDLGVDYISRKAALDITWHDPSYSDPLNVLTEVRDKIRELPSVTPQEPKTGHWEHGEYCSECGCDVPAYIVDWRWQKDMDAKYCPNCGCRMVEPQESEDKE